MISVVKNICQENEGIQAYISIKYEQDKVYNVTTPF